jgi:hypothetical protein
MILDAAEWAKSEFQVNSRLDARVRRRLVAAATIYASTPVNTSVLQRFHWDELKSLYQLIGVAAKYPDRLQEVHRTQTRQRMMIKKPVLIIHDQTALVYTTHRAVADQLGPLNDTKTRGFLQHNSLAVDPNTGELLGLIYQQTFCRENKPKGETRCQLYRRKIRESEKWIEGVNAVGVMPHHANWVHMGDRGADFYGLFATIQQTNAHFVIRLSQDRLVKNVLTVPGKPMQDVGDEADETEDEIPIDAAAEEVAAEPTEEEKEDAEVRRYLKSEARKVTAIATKTIDILGKGGRPGREAKLSLGAIRVMIRPPKAEPRWRHMTPMMITVVRIWEENPPEGVQPLEWILGTNFRDASPSALLRYCGWYEWRWPTMEEYHKAQKSGVGIETIRYQTKERLLAAIAFLSVLAVRVLSMRWSLDQRPDEPAEKLASVDEIAMLQKALPEKPIETVRDFIQGVASLGGWLGRKCDGPPGWKTIWRGYQRLADLLWGAELGKSKNRQRYRT